jgi:succinyl-diaminopimelate desuccinylase
MFKRITKLANKLISLQTTNNNFGAKNTCLEAITEELRGFSFKSFANKGTKSIVFYNTKSFPKKFKLLLNAHIDVVPGGKSQFKATMKNGKSFGRGAYDMKSAVAVFVILFKKLSNDIKYPFGLQIVTDEEIGGFNGTAFQVQKGIRADFVLCGEPTDLNIGIQSKGVLAIDIVALGKSSHASQPWEGSNAVVKLTEIITNIVNLFPVSSENKWVSTCNLSWIKTTNEQSNLVPDNATARLDIRFIPEDKRLLLRKIKSVLSRNVSVKIIHFESEHDTDPENIFVKKLAFAISSVLGNKPKLIKHHFTSDLRHFQKVGCVGVTFGPRGGGMHTENEYVDLNSLQKYFDILERFVTELN